MYFGEWFVIVLTAIVTSYFMLMNEDKKSDNSNMESNRLITDLKRISGSVGKVCIAYIKTQLVIMLITSVICFIGFMIMKNNYALFIAILVSVLDALPIIGVGILLIPFVIIYIILGNYFKAGVTFIVFVICYLVREFAEPKLMGDQIGISPIMSLISMYVGYKYGTTGSLENNRLNTNDSTIKTYIDNWYKNNLTAYTKYLSNDAVYCNDRELASLSTYSTTRSFNYASYERIDFTSQPTYNCTNMSDAFSVNNTSAKLDYPVGLMSIDELSYAGGEADKSLTAPYAWYYTNANGESITGSNLTWSLTPYYLGMFGVSVWGVHGSDSPGSLVQALVGNLAVVRPAISLKSCVKYSSGDGTADNPYTIKETTSGC